MNLEQLRQERAQLAAQAEEILARSETTIEGPDRGAFDAAVARIEEIDADLERRAVLTRSIAGRPDVVRESGDGAAGAGHLIDRARSVNVNRGAGRAELLERAGHAGGPGTHEGAVLVRDAARAAISSWSDRSDVPADFQECAERIVAGPDKYSAGVAEWVAVGSDPTYERAFRTYLTGGPAALMGDEALAMRKVQTFLSERAMSEGSIAAGQAAVPPMLDPLVVLSNAGQANSFRQLCTIKTIATQTWRGITSAGISAEWTAEASEFTDASPTLTQPTITPIKGDAYCQLSWELLDDSSLMADLASLFADARDRLEATAFCTGSGSTSPTGITTALDLTTASRLSCTTASVVGVVDLYKMDGALPPRWRRNANWMANKSVLNEVRQAVNTTVANYSPWVDFAGDMPSKAIGYGVYEASGLSTSTASNADCLILGDWRGGMYIVDRTPTVIASTPWIVGTNRRPIGATGVAMHFRVGSDVVVPSAFIMLRR